MADHGFILPISTLPYHPKPYQRLQRKSARTVKKTTATAEIATENAFETNGEQIDVNWDRYGRANKRTKNMCKKESDEDAPVDVEALRHGVQEIDIVSGSQEDSGDEFARQIEAAFDEPSDNEMEDVSTKVKTEEELVKEAWAAFDAAVAEDPTAIPKPKPPVIDDRLREPQFHTRKRDLADELAELTSSRAKYIINLDISFDVSAASQRRKDRNMHYHMFSRDAPTIKNLFHILWLENHEWLIHEGYGLERVRRVQRLEIVLLIKEGAVVKNTQFWTIKGDFGGREQCSAWKEFLEAANRWGRGEALDQLRMMDNDERKKRKRYVKDGLGNLYDHTGNCVEIKRKLVHAMVDAEIVMHFD